MRSAFQFNRASITAILAVAALFLAIAFVAGARAEARQGPVVLGSDAGEVVELAPHTEVLLDDTASLTLPDVMATEARFAPVATRYLDFGLGSFRIWLKVDIVNRTDAARRLRIDLGRQFTQDLQLFLVRGDEAPITLILHAINDPFGERPSGMRTLAADFDVPAGEAMTLYVGYRSTSTTALPMRLGAPEAILAARAHETSVDALLTGVLLAMIAMAALMTPIIGWRLGIAFTVYIAAAMLYVGHADGYTFKYLWPGLGGLNDALNLSFLLLMVATSFAFARLLFGFKQRWPAYDRVLLGFIAVAVGFALLAVPFAGVTWLMVIAYLIVPVGALLQLATGILVRRGRYLGATPYLIASIFIVVTFLYALVAHLAPGHFDLDSTLDVGHLALVVESASFAVAIVIRVLGVRLERDAAMRAELVAVNEKLAMSSTLRETQHRYIEARELSSQRQSQLVSISHDLQQPLAALRKSLDRIAGNDEASAEQMHKALDYLETLARDQLKAKASETKQAQADGVLEVFPIGVVLRNVHAMFRNEARERGVRLRLHVLEDLVLADAVSVMRLVSNLVQNALQHSGGDAILIAARRRGTHVRVEILDNGGGLSETELERLGGRFEKGDQSRGHGLGLSIVKDISDQYGLNLRFRSQPGRGMCASAEIPLNGKS